MRLSRPRPANAFMLGWQVGAKFDFPHIVYFQLAPTLYNYTGDGNTFNVHFSGDPGGNQTGINSLLVFDIPAEIGWKVGKIPMRIFGDFATNFDADDRADAAGHPDKGGDRYAYQIGLGIGQLKKKARLGDQRVVATPGPVCAGSKPGRYRNVRQQAELARRGCESRVHAG